ncbi:GNAT family N-acetyltransferase [Fibrella forsythiae]|uniref:GNAT family N-acetyltransferase n=1 Tax=Fibrella forsythiae TaxID=2817061 RepID=A0ABS3JST5_9BACT|nr:GNAT family N-acetyltransferase [Fibrella forsythiae]MBO0953066.1 GNAT family N-acetyltransferase [Fibrella forsythiae]
MKVVRYDPFHLPDLRALYYLSRQTAFPWEDPSGYTLLDFDLVTQDESILVAVDQQRPVGFISWWPPDNFIHSLFVDPAFIRKGVGKSLLQACLAHIGRPATLKCKTANQNALQFYYAQGWLPIDTVVDAGDPYLLLAFNG